jgi:hypothetical protein
LSARLDVLIGAVVGLFVLAFVDGIIVGVGIKTGVEPSEEGVGLFVLESLCKSTENSSSQNARIAASNVCGIFITVIVVYSIVAFFANVIGAARAFGNWRWGLLIYGIGFIIGLLLIVTS